MPPRLDERWLSDFWFAQDGDDMHVLYLQAPRSLGDPELGHRKRDDRARRLTRRAHVARVLDDPFPPGPPGAFDDLANVLRPRRPAAPPRRVAVLRMGCATRGAASPASSATRCRCRSAPTARCRSTRAPTRGVNGPGPILAPGLRVLFVGINPSLRSAEVGHHFARPGNRFWMALHAAGYTPRRLRPDEDGELPACGLGITNLVAAPRAPRRS